MADGRLETQRRARSRCSTERTASDLERVALWLGRPAGYGRSRKRRCPRSAGLHRPRVRSDVDLSRATIRRRTWTQSQVLPRRWLLLKGDGISAGGDIGGASRAGCVRAARSCLSSVGDAATVRAPRSSSPTSVRPPRRLGAGVVVSASRWTPGQVSPSAKLVACRAIGEGSSELDPRRRLIRPGASVSERRCPLRGGRQSRRRFATRVSGRTRLGRVLLRTRPVRLLAKPSRRMAKSLELERSSEEARAGNGSSWRGDFRACSGSCRRYGRPIERRVGIASALSIVALRPRVEVRGFGPESKRVWIEVASLARPADQRGPHVGGNIGVPRSTQPIAR
jgi:hypothetical protein